jgi:Superinfection exclusion gene product 17
MPEVTNTNPPAEGALRLWWIPQVPGKPFRVVVDTVYEAKQVYGLPAEYDLFQFKHNIKPDYSNAGGLEEFVEGEWMEWTNDCGQTISGVINNGDECDEDDVLI